MALEEPSRFDLIETHKKLRTAAGRPDGLAGVDRRTLKYAPWVIFEAWEGERALAEDRGFLKAYLRRLADATVSAAILNLAIAFLRFYPRGLPYFQPLRQAVDRLLGKCGSSRCSRLRACCDRFGLLDADGPLHFWRWLAEQHQAVEDALQEGCLAGPLTQSGFAEAVFEQALLTTGAALGSGRLTVQGLDRLLGFSLVKGERGEALRFQKPTHRIGLAESLLLPFAEPEAPVNQLSTIQEFLIKHYRDPRIDRSRWHGVSEEAVSVMLGWLVKDTLEDFFRLLEYTARGDSTASRHWHYRKAFWTAYLRAGVIRDAWVVLAPLVDVEARRILGGRGEGYGRLERGTGVLRNHAALIIRIDRLVITEWSHSGKYRVWDEGSTGGDRVPRLYQPRYGRNELVWNPEEEGAHHGAEDGHWQSKLSDYVRRKTGIRMNHRELMPR